MINVGDQLHQETTESHGSQSTSMTMAIHQVPSHRMGVPSRFQGHWEPGKVILMLRSDSGSILHEVKSLQLSMTSTRCKTTTKPRRSQSSQQTTVKIPSRVHGNHRNLWEDTATSKYGTFERPAFHNFTNVIFGSTGGNINGLIWSML